MDGANSIAKWWLHSPREFSMIDDRSEQMELEFFEWVLESNELSDAAAGITRLVIDKGEGALSTKQQYVFQTQVLDVYVTKQCKRCNLEVIWDEMIGAHLNGGYCGWCAKMLSNDD